MAVAVERRAKPSEPIVSPKHPHTWFIDQINLGNWNVRAEVTRDILANARELDPRPNWAVIIPTITHNNQAGRFLGEEAIARSVAPNIATLCRDLGWGMSSPEIVYLGCIHIYGSMGVAIQRIAGEMCDAEEKGYQMDVYRMRDNIGRLRFWKKLFGDSVTSFVRGRERLNSESYRTALRRLMYLKNLNQRPDKDTLFGLFREGRNEDLTKYITDFC